MPILGGVGRGGRQLVGEQGLFEASGNFPLICFTSCPVQLICLPVALQGVWKGLVRHQGSQLKGRNGMGEEGMGHAWGKKPFYACWSEVQRLSVHPVLLASAAAC